MKKIKSCIFLSENSVITLDKNNTKNQISCIVDIILKDNNIQNIDDILTIGNPIINGYLVIEDDDNYIEFGHSDTFQDNKNEINLWSNFDNFTDHSGADYCPDMVTEVSVRKKDNKLYFVDIELTDTILIDDSGNVIYKQPNYLSLDMAINSIEDLSIIEFTEYEMNNAITNELQNNVDFLSIFHNYLVDIYPENGEKIFNYLEPIMRYE